MPTRRDGSSNALYMVIVVLLKSDKKLDCEHFIRENLQLLINTRTDYGNSFLHLAVECIIDSVPCTPLAKLLVEKGMIWTSML